MYIGQRPLWLPYLGRMENISSRAHKSLKKVEKRLVEVKSFKFAFWEYSCSDSWGGCFVSFLKIEVTLKM